MKKKLMILSGLVLSAISLNVLSSCGGDPRKTDDTLYVVVYDGGYGREWIDTIASNYETKTGVKVEVTMDNSILDRIESEMKNGSNYDIYISHDINWKSYAASGYLAELDDLYSSSVEGTGKKFIERLCNDAAENSKYKGEDGTEHYYKVCYTQGAGGLVYNVDLFQKNGWGVPTTYSELKKLCETISATEIPGGDRGETYSPFAWSGSDRQYYWDYLVFPWWYELAGESRVETILQYKGPDGKYATGYEMYNPDNYYKEFYEAYDMWYNLVANATNNNSIDKAFSSSLINAQSAFANGKAAMIPYAQWAKYEIENAVKKDDLGFNIKMMKTPKAKEDSTTQYNYNVGFGDSMIIPADSPNIQKAKDFLNYLATYDACKTFVEKSDGAFLAFDYSDVDLSSLSSNTYVTSIHEILTTTKNFNLVSDNEITYWNTNTVMPWLQNKYYYAQACQAPSENTSAKIGPYMYSQAKAGWSSWLRNAGLRD